MSLVKHSSSSGTAWRRRPSRERPLRGRSVMTTSVIAVFAVMTGLALFVLDEASAQQSNQLSNSDSQVLRHAGADSLTAEQHFRKGQQFEDLGLYGQAIEEYEWALGSRSGHLGAYRALERIRSSDVFRVGSSLDRLRLDVAANPNDPELRRQYGDALYGANKLDEAIRQYQAYLSQAQASPRQLKKILISIAASDAHHDLGERIASQYRAYYPSDDDLVMRLGYFQLWQGDFADARRTFQVADSMKSGNGSTIRGLHLADSLAAAADYRKARYAELERTLVLHAGNHAKRLELIDMLMQDGHYFDAFQHLETIRNTPGLQVRVGTDVEKRREKLKKAAVSNAVSSTDRLFLRVYQNPDDLERRYALVEGLLTRKRFYEAYDQLSAMESVQRTSKRWLTLFVEADSGLVRSKGRSPIYGVDRMLSLARANPANLSIRYGLIDSLIARDRYVEAGDLLLGIANVAPDDAGFTGRVEAVAKGRIQLAYEQIERADAMLAKGLVVPDPLRRELVDHYLIVGDLSKARRQFEQIIQTRPSDLSLKLAWTEFLRETGDLKTAMKETEILLAGFGSDPDVQKQYVLSHLDSGLDARGRRLLFQLMSDSVAADAKFLANVADLFVKKGETEQARTLVERIHALEDPQQNLTVHMIAQRIERESLWNQQMLRAETLQRAQDLAVDSLFEEAASAFELFFSSYGIQHRNEWRQLATVLVADHRFDDARRILEKLNASVVAGDLSDLEDAQDLKKQLARVRANTEDPDGALALLDEVMAFNPNDYEARFLAAELHREYGGLEVVRSVYDEAIAKAGNSPWLDANRTSIEADLRNALALKGKWQGRDFAGIVAPTASSVHAEGGDTYYNRRSRGLRAEVTLPIGAVLTTGFESHFITGTRRLVPDAEAVRERVNQVYGGVYWDLTAPIASEKAPYTNRFFTEIGLFDYEGQRSVGYVDVRYWRQDPGRYIADVGLRTTEGSIDLWSAGGGEFNLRLTQLNARAEAVPVLPDSLLRMKGRMAIDVVSDNLGILSSNGDQNIGTDLFLQAGYRVLNHTYVGLAYSQLDFKSRTDIYFSPEHYESTEIFLEYEDEVPSAWYLRIRGSIGAISRSAGALSKRIEVDLIKRLTNKLSLTLTSTLGEASRSLGGGDASAYSRYDMLSISGRVYWTL